MRLQKLNMDDKREISFIENLYEESFPKNERRPKERMLNVYKDEPKFQILLAWSENNPVGFFNYWDLGTFIFVEHFAVCSKHRNKGYGSKILNSIKSKVSKPIILEVELPIEEMAKRRIIFYEREGFTLWDKVNYNQPSYYNDGKSYPMKLMALGKLSENSDSQNIINLIHTIPYKH
ncbi:GNAT family N-acetyltransferase [Apibacter muscae]|uniref:GNAT family N-acetyltransferase n=1 Tax=Apibacter muscae TaxID=2509004 RepID=UPI0011ABD0D7|nr:GNAT family N-acetyltransferase [Apibacter muscae]TWP22732.1 GNAT family N-acetyltransferase [Apibacter muscae]